MIFCKPLQHVLHLINVLDNVFSGKARELNQPCVDNVTFSAFSYARLICCSFVQCGLHLYQDLIFIMSALWYQWLHLESLFINFR